MTNDDGVESPGLLALTVALVRAGHDCTVVAPTSDRSGASAAIGPLHRLGPIPLVEHHWPEVPSVRVVAIDQPPAAAVYAACLGGFGDPPELVASGVNPGPNTGHLVLHSGTVGAALTAAGLGVPGVAVSIAMGETFAWETASTIAAACVDWAAQPHGGPRVLNVNVPNCVLHEVKGVREAHLAPYGTVWAGSADTADGHVQLEFTGNDVEGDPDTDLALVRAGFAAVTPLHGIARADLRGAATAASAALETR
ncbi:MAG TPA: 5'/3'-nucleotidase SurE [Acidimicrobiia bacterium]|nr:5'/3'-nucleotidase SurE [Acidimicrobiia bacterium]